MNKGVYNNKLRAAKRRIWDSLKADGFQTDGVRHGVVVSEFINRNNLKRPVDVRWQDYIISLYENESP